MTFHIRPKLGLEAVAGSKLKYFALRLNNACRLRIAKVRRQLNQRVQDRRQVKRRAADNLENVSGRGLLLSDSNSRSFVEQPHVLDGDDGLAWQNFSTSLICFSLNGRTP